MSNGRFAPSPTGRLHLGNLRTALVSWLWARSMSGSWHIRFEDLDQLGSSIENEFGQSSDLADLGMESDTAPVRQSERFGLYREYIAALDAQGLLYPCYCTRKEIREEVARSASAPNGPPPPGHYPGTCRTLTTQARAESEASGRPAALRVRASEESVSFVDRFAGPTAEVVDDFVIQRNDGIPAYNLAVVVDDVLQEVEVVVRGNDLLTSTPRQIWVADQLGLSPPDYAHIPLVLNDTGGRLAKRDGSVTLPDRRALGETNADVLGFLLRTVGCAVDGPVSSGRLDEFVATFDSSLIPPEPIVFRPG